MIRELRINYFVKMNVHFLMKIILLIVFSFLLSSCKPEKVNPPIISGVSPSTGPISGGTILTINGSDFKSSTSVIVGNKLCSIVSSSSDTITCKTATNLAGDYNVSVTNSNTPTSTLSAAFTYIAPATITSITPTSGFASGGTTITINGSGFTNGATVKIGSANCTTTVFNPSLLTCVTTATNAGVYSITLTNGDGQLTTLANAYTFRAPPTVSTIVRNAGPLGGNTNVTITGTGFYTGTQVYFGANLCGSLVVVNPTTINCVSPSSVSQGGVLVKVLNLDGHFATVNNGFTYQLAPVYSSVSPSIIGLTAGTPLTITGSNFVTGATVSVGGQACTNPVLVNPSTIN